MPHAAQPSAPAPAVHARRLFRVAKAEIDEFVYEVDLVEAFNGNIERAPRPSSDGFASDDRANYYGIVDTPLTLLDGQRVVQRVPRALFSGRPTLDKSKILRAEGDEYVQIANPGLVLRNGKPYLFFLHRWQYEHVATANDTLHLFRRCFSRENYDAPPRHLMLEIDGNEVNSADPEIAIFDYRGSQAAYHRNELYQPAGLPHRSVQLWKREAGCKSTSTPQFIATREGALIDPDVDLSGHIALNRKTGDPESILYQGQLFPLNDRTRQRDGWYYSSNDDRAIRFKEDSEGSMLIEEMPRRVDRFPEEQPLFIRHHGTLFEVHRITDDGKLIHAHGGMFRSDHRGSLREIDYDDYKLTPLAYDEDLWSNLERNRGADFPHSYENIDVFLTELAIGDHDARMHAYRQYRLQYGGHDILLQLPDESNAGGVARHVHNVLRGMPHKLLEGGRKITVLPKGVTFDNINTVGSYLKGQIMIVHPENYDSYSEFSLGEVLYHEFAHSFTQDIPTLFRIALTSAVVSAYTVDRRWGYIEYARKNWKEALCVGFQRFDKTFPAMRRLILNLLLNPAFAPDDPRFQP